MVPLKVIAFELTFYLCDQTIKMNHIFHPFKKTIPYSGYSIFTFLSFKISVIVDIQTALSALLELTIDFRNRARVV